MSKVKITGHASGTGVLTVTAPNTSTDRTITLPDATGTLLNSDGDGSSLTGVGGAWTVITSQTASASSSLDFTGINSTYSTYAFVLSDIVPATDTTELNLLTSTDGGSSYDNSSANYYYATLSLDDAGSAQNTYTGVGNSIMRIIGSAQSMGNASGESGSAIVYLYEPSNASTTTKCSWTASWVNQTGKNLIGIGSGRRNSIADVDAVRFIQSSGNITSGKITMYGIATS